MGMLGNKRSLQIVHEPRRDDDIGGLFLRVLAPYGVLASRFLNVVLDCLRS